MSSVEDFQKSVETLRLGKIRRLGCYTKPGDQGWVDIDNKFIAAAINLPSVQNMIIVNAEMLKRDADIAACRKAIEESQAKEAAARKHLESMGVIA
jgi:hypothetical protein